MTEPSSKSPVENKEEHNHTDDIPKQNQINEGTKQKLIMYGIFLILFGGALLFYFKMPKMSPQLGNRRIQFFRIPKSGEDFRQIYEVLHRYSQGNSHLIHAFLAYMYIYMQSFGIPVTTAISILIGALFGWTKGLITCWLCSFSGASTCYWISKIFGTGFINKMMPSMLEKLQRRVAIEKEKKNLFWYTLFMRVTPLIPNWFMNMSSAIVGIPFHIFFFATMIGYIPINIALVSTGQTLSEITTVGFNPKLFFVNIGLGCLALIPTCFKKKLAEKMEKMD